MGTSLAGGTVIVKTNRIALLGGAAATLGFFFLPLIELRPNRLASGVPFGLLQLAGDVRYTVLFVLAIAPLLVALVTQGRTRGWILATLGNLLLVLTLFVPALASEQLLTDAATFLDEGVRLSNPRVLPSGALILGLLGGYMVLFAGLGDLARAQVGRVARFFAAWTGVALIALLFVRGRFDVYSVVVEFHRRGEQLGQGLVEHTMFVAVALVVGLVLGIGLGLWAHRDAQAAPVVLYAVGIIQTLPSLALFGLLLAPLARLGNQRAFTIGLFLLLAGGAAALLITLYRRTADSLATRPRYALLIASAVVSAAPLALVTVIFSSFLFRSSLRAFTSAAAPFPLFRTLLLALLLVAAALWGLGRALPPGGVKRFLRALSWSAGGVFGIVLLVALGRASSQLLGGVESIQTLVMRDLGVSGIGTAPAVIALTLYSLLPLVRNTYAGLGNVDPAVTDSGRGMGMNAAQRFMQLELPIALPVIMAGVRNAAVSLVGIGAVAAVIGAGGLGEFILGGIINTSIDQILLGALPAVLLAVVLDTGLRGLERLLVSPGIRQLET